MKKVLNNRLFDILEYQKKHYPREDALCDKRNGVWRKFSTDQIIENADKVSLGLLKLGYKKGERIAIISYNRTEWTMTDLGILQMGGIDVPMYPNMSEEDYEYIFNDAEIRAVFVENQELLDKVLRILPKTPTIREIFSFEKLPNSKHWTDVQNIAEESLRNELNEVKNSIDEFDLATIIYTSGTTGVPKGVLLSHSNILSNVLQVQQVQPHNNTHTMFSFLPICHIFERTAIYFYLLVGGAIYFAESIEMLGENIKEVKPHFFTTVPRVLEKIYDKIMQKGRELTGAKKAIFGWAAYLGDNYHPQGKNGLLYNMQLSIARKLVFSKWQEALGGNVQGVISGAAALQPRLGRIFSAAGIPVRSGYGLTETSPVLTCNRFNKDDWYIGTVGTPLPEVEIKIDESGEILAKGPNVTKGYFNKPEDTAASIDEEGWFHTGDIGEWVDGKFLKITDRLKEVFKTSGGKFVAPLPIENKIKESLFIEQIMIVGENKNFVSAVIFPDFNFIEKWCKKKCANLGNRAQMLDSPILKERIWQDINEFNQKFGKVRQVKKFVLVADEWTVESGELTPTLKLKRRVILKKYAHLIEKMYQEEDKSHY